jgi:hypothetical protein
LRVSSLFSFLLINESTCEQCFEDSTLKATAIGPYK